jgi:beta-glucosidase-like glycosyl hydrolase
VQRVRELQRTVVESSRLGIPAIVHEECLTGFTTYQATVYPTALAWAATFDPDLVHEMASAIGRGLAAVGVHQGLSPVLDVVRDYRWGRVEETMGEDPYLVSQLGTAYVRGLEDNGIIATLKHFAGYWRPRTH